MEFVDTIPSTLVTGMSGKVPIFTVPGVFIPMRMDIFIIRSAPIAII